jgi:hypothetical protein
MHSSRQIQQENRTCEDFYFSNSDLCLEEDERMSWKNVLAGGVSNRNKRKHKTKHYFVRVSFERTGSKWCKN